MKDQLLMWTATGWIRAIFHKGQPS